MSFKRLIGSLVLALSLTGGQSLAASVQEPTPDKQLEAIPNKEGEIVPVTVDLAFQDAKPDSDEKIDDGFLPELPILLDGKQYSAEELQKAEVHISHFVLDSRSAEMNVIQAFRTSEDMKAYLDKTGQLPADQDKLRQGWCGIPSFFFEHSFYGGSWFAVPPGWGYGNLGGFWNDRISSLWGSPCASWTLITEHSNFNGHRLWIGRGWAVPSLAPLGWIGWSGWWPVWYSWNDRVSSVWVYW